MSRYEPFLLQVMAGQVMRAGHKDPRYKALVKQCSKLSGLSIGTTIRKIQELADNGTTK